ncbi:Brp/Blh family beta-carotene 15,15'-dioxygenase [Aquirufa sp. A-Brett2-15D]
MKNYIGAIITIVYLICYLLMGPWDKTIDFIFAGILLLLTGIPHGAGDHLIAQKIADRHHLSFHLRPFIMYYLGSMAAYAVLWYLFPSIAFIIFIGISVFHFGDMEDLSAVNPKQNILHLARTIFLGSGILSFILFSHWNEVVEVVTEMKVPIPLNIPSYLIYLSLILLLLGFQKRNSAYFLNTFLTLVAGYFLPLIPAFICYFSCCHAVYSFMGLKNHLETSFLNLYKKLLPFSVGAFFMGLVYMFLTSNALQLYPIFIFLSLLTLPHFLLMHKLIKRPR